MTAPLIPTQTPSTELVAALTAANKLQREGVEKKQIDAFLLDRYSMTKAALTAAVKAMPQEVAPKALTTKTLLKAQAYAATGGWTDEIEGLIGALKGTGYKKARDAARKEMAEFERDYPWLARSMKAVGVAGSAIGGGLLARGAIGALTGTHGARAAMAGSEAARLGALGRTLTGAGVGANAGAGGLMGEPTGETRGDMLMDRARGAAGGALLGAAAGSATALPDALAVGSSPLKRIIPLLGAGAAGHFGPKLLNYLSGNK